MTLSTVCSQKLLEHKNHVVIAVIEGLSLLAYNDNALCGIAAIVPVNLKSERFAKRSDRNKRSAVCNFRFNGSFHSFAVYKDFCAANSEYNRSVADLCRYGLRCFIPLYSAAELFNDRSCGKHSRSIAALSFLQINSCVVVILKYVTNRAVIIIVRRTYAKSHIALKLLLKVRLHIALNSADKSRNFASCKQECADTEVLCARLLHSNCCIGAYVLAVANQTVILKRYMLKIVPSTDSCFKIFVLWKKTGVDTPSETVYEECRTCRLITVGVGIACRITLKH